MSNNKLWTPSTTNCILNEFIKSLDKDLNIKNYGISEDIFQSIMQYANHLDKFEKSTVALISA